MECPNCHGYGSSLMDESDRCSSCDGTGIVAPATPQETAFLGEPIGLPPEPGPRFVILKAQATGAPPLYWSIALGWLEPRDAAMATEYEPSEKAAIQANPGHFPIPIGPFLWVCARCSHGDPTHPRHVCR